MGFHMVVLVLIFWRSSIRFSKVLAPECTTESWEALKIKKKMFIDFRDTGREREKHWCEKYLPDWGLNSQPRCVPWPGIVPPTFWCIGWCSHQLRHTGQALGSFLKTWLPSLLCRDLDLIGLRYGQGVFRCCLFCFLESRWFYYAARAVNHCSYSTLAR